MNEKLNDLFGRWQKEIDGKFVRDGIIDENNYKNVIWLLRETNGFSGNLSELINSCIYDKSNHENYWKTPRTHFKQSIAVFALLNPGLTNSKIKKHKIDGLKYSAVVNIKKISGGKTSNIDAIYKHLVRYFPYLKEEIEILEPKVVIVGGMKGKKRIRKKLIDGFHLKKLESFKVGTIYKSESGAIFLEVYHPSYPGINWDDWIDFFKYVGKNLS